MGRQVHIPEKFVRLAECLAETTLCGSAPSKLKTVFEKCEWEQAHSFLCSHGLEGIAVFAMEQLGGTAHFPQAKAITERARYRAGIRLYQEDFLRRLGERFRDEKIFAATTRTFGPLENLYPAKDMRSAGDIDLLIPEEHMGKAADILKALGFSHEAQDNLFIKTPLNIDCALSPGEWLYFTNLAEEFSSFPELADNWRDKCEAGIYPGIHQFTLPQEFVFDAVHYAYKHRFAKTVWAIDLMLLAKDMTEEQMRATAVFATETGCAQIVAHAIDHTLKIHATDEMNKLRAMLPGKDSRWLRRRFFKKCSKHPTPLETGYILAWSCAREWDFRIALLKKILTPSNKPLRRDFAEQENGTVTPDKPGRLSRILKIPSAFWRAIR